MRRLRDLGSILAACACLSSGAEGQTHELTGRLFGPDGRPLTCRAVQLEASTTIGHVGRRVVQEVYTDELARLRHDFGDALGRGRCRRVTLRATDPSGAGELNRTLFLDADAEKVELGDVVLVGEPELGSVRGLRDAALERSLGDSASTWGMRRREVLLLEVARRGGERWSRILIEKFDRATVPDDEWSSFGLDELLADAYLATARRAAGLPAPLHVATSFSNGTWDEEHQVLVATYPDLPRVGCSLVNVDALGRTVPILSPGSGDRRCDSLRVHALRSDGRVAWPRADPGPYVRWEHRSSLLLRPGDEMELAEVHLADYALLPGPGRYTVVLQYDDDANITSQADVTDHVLHESAELSIRLEPMTYRVGRERVRECAAWLEAINVSEPVPIAKETWRPDLEYSCEATTPEDHLFRAGRDALPALFDALREERSRPAPDRQRLGWILGMLWNIEGLTPGPSVEWRFIARHREYPRWPSTMSERSGEPGVFGPPPPGPWDGSLAFECEAVLEQAEWFVFDIVD